MVNTVFEQRINTTSELAREYVPKIRWTGRFTVDFRFGAISLPGVCQISDKPYTCHVVRPAHSRSPGIPIPIDKRKSVHSDLIVTSSVDFLYIRYGRDGKVFSGWVGMSTDFRSVIKGQAGVNQRCITFRAKIRLTTSTECLAPQEVHAGSIPTACRLIV